MVLVLELHAPRWLARRNEWIRRASCTSGYSIHSGRLDKSGLYMARDLSGPDTSARDATIVPLFCCCNWRKREGAFDFFQSGADNRTCSFSIIIIGGYWRP